MDKGLEKELIEGYKEGAKEALRICKEWEVTSSEVELPEY